MSDMMRQMLDELMGTNRDGTQKDETFSVKFTSSKVCKSYLVGLCPHDLFHHNLTLKSNKKLNLGICNKIHDPALKADYELAAKEKTFRYEYFQMDHIRQFVDECDTQIAVNKRHLMKLQEETDGPESEILSVVEKLGEQIAHKLAEAEDLGSEGKVEESLVVTKEAERLKDVKRDAVDNYRKLVPSFHNQRQKLRVCEVCAAHLCVYDDDRHLADHFRGKLHMGFIKLRALLTELESAHTARGRNIFVPDRVCSYEMINDRSSSCESRNSKRSVESERDRSRKRERSRSRRRHSSGSSYSSDSRHERSSYRSRERSRERASHSDKDRSRSRSRSRSYDSRRKSHRSKRSRHDSEDSRDSRRASEDRDRRSRSRSSDRHTSSDGSRERSRRRTKKRSRSRSRSRERSTSDDSYHRGSSREKDKKRSSDKAVSPDKEVERGKRKDASRSSSRESRHSDTRSERRRGRSSSRRSRSSSRSRRRSRRSRNGHSSLSSRSSVSSRERSRHRTDESDAGRKG